MNYRRAYISIISNAKKEKSVRLQNKKAKTIQYENHHILPKAIFPLWKERKDNLVLLTTREHYICHMLLDKIYPNKQMFLAFWSLINRRELYYIRGSRDYQRARDRFLTLQTSEEARKIQSEKIKEWAKTNKSPTLGMRFYTDGIVTIRTKEECPEGFRPGRTLSESHRNNLIQANNSREYLRGENHPSFGKHHSLETRKKLGDKSRGHKLSEEAIAKMKSKLIGRKASDEARKHISEALKGQTCVNKGKKWFTNGEVDVMSTECPEGFRPGRSFSKKE